MNPEKKNQLESFSIAISFTLLILIVSNKLTNASLWFDEAIEYWYSKTFYGATPGHTEWSMYERIVSTYQPPLFNFVLHFWLKIYDSEWWLRFFGVIMATMGGAGTYKAIKEATRSKLEAAGSIILYALIFRQTYYWQEVAEYSLMLAMLPWCIYYFISFMHTPQKKYFIGITVFSILAVYSQYGAVFIIVPILLLTLIKVFSNKQKKMIFFTTIVYAISAIVAAAPLYFLFLKKQMENQGSSFREVNNSWLSSFNKNYLNVFKFVLVGSTSTSGEICIQIISVILLAFAIYFLLKGKDIALKYLIVSNIVTFVIYYYSVASGAYAYGGFGNRYCNFLIPLWFITGIYLLDELIKVIPQIKPINKLKNIQFVTLGIVITLLVCWGLNGWDSLKNNWGKENIREATQAWYHNKGYESNTLVYYAADPGFAYYLQHNNKYNDSYLDNIVYQTLAVDTVGNKIAVRDRTEEYYINYYNQIYGEGKWPTNLYFVGSHIRGDLDTMVLAFTDNGYTATDLYNARNGRLIYLCVQ